jgi:hypothetical protein
MTMKTSSLFGHITITTPDPGLLPFSYVSNRAVRTVTGGSERFLAQVR